MNIERAAMKGRLADLEEQKKKAILRCETIQTEVRRELNSALIPVEDVDVAKVDQLVDDLVAGHIDIANLNGQILRLKRELG